MPDTPKRTATSRNNHHGESSAVASVCNTANRRLSAKAETLDGPMQYLHIILVAGYVAVVAMMSFLARWFIGEQQ